MMSESSRPVRKVSLKSIKDVYKELDSDEISGSSEDDYVPGKRLVSSDSEDGSKTKEALKAKKKEDKNFIYQTIPTPKKKRRRRTKGDSKTETTDSKAEKTSKSAKSAASVVPPQPIFRTAPIWTIPSDDDIERVSAPAPLSSFVPQQVLMPVPNPQIFAETVPRTVQNPFYSPQIVQAPVTLSNICFVTVNDTLTTNSIASSYSANNNLNISVNLGNYPSILRSTIMSESPAKRPHSPSMANSQPAKKGKLSKDPSSRKDDGNESDSSIECLLEESKKLKEEKLKSIPLVTLDDSDHSCDSDELGLTKSKFPDGVALKRKTQNGNHENNGESSTSRGSNGLPGENNNNYTNMSLDEFTEMAVAEWDNL